MVNKNNSINKYKRKYIFKQRVKKYTALISFITIVISCSSCAFQKIENSEEFNSLNPNSILGVYNNIAYYYEDNKIMSLSIANKDIIKNIVLDEISLLDYEKNTIYYKMGNTINSLDLSTQNQLNLITSNNIMSAIKKNNYIYYSEDSGSKVINLETLETPAILSETPCLFTPDNAYFVKTEKTYSSFTLYGYTQTIEESIKKLNTCEYNESSINTIKTEDISRFTFYNNSLIYCTQNTIYKINPDGNIKTMVRLDNSMRNIGSVNWGDGSDDNIYIKDGYIFYKTNYFYNKGNESYLQIDTFKISVDGDDFSVVGDPYITRTY